jgi:transposase
MLGRPKRRESRLFHHFDLDTLVPADHRLRLIDAAVDFEFVRREVASLYGRRGHASLDPAVTMKLLLLLFLENLSQRELMRQLPLRLDWLWFCGFEVGEQTPDHSVLSKARKRWGAGVFERLFEHVLERCVEAGLVDAEHVHVDASVNAAAASLDSLRPHLRVRVQQVCDGLEETGPARGADAPVVAAPEAAAPDASAPAASLEAPEPAPLEPSAPAAPQASAPVEASAAASPDASAPAAADTPAASEPRPGQPISTSDPEARLTRKAGRLILGYKDHRVIDDRCGIITATLTTPADVDDGAMLEAALGQHERTLQVHVREVVADRGYGHAENYRMLHERGTRAVVPHKKSRENPAHFSRSLFVFDPCRDVYTCPQGQTLHRHGSRYRAEPGVCAACAMKQQCTTAGAGRQLRRHPLQHHVDRADAAVSREHRRRRLGRRKYLAEGRFADATNCHGYKRLRWKGCAGATTQHLLIAVAQNLRKLIASGRRPRHRAAGHVAPPLTSRPASLSSRRLVRPHQQPPGRTIHRRVLRRLRGR